MPQPEQSSVNILSLNLPSAGNSLEISLEGVSLVKFVFDMSAATFEPSGDNFIITGDNGGRVLLCGFFTHKPDLLLPDGTLLGGEDVTEAFRPAEELEPQGFVAEAGGQGGAASAGER